jgi:hypothetical protein
MDDSEFFTREAAGAYMLSTYFVGAPRYLAKLATMGGGPRYVTMGRRVLYRREDLDAWARERMSEPRVSTSDDGATRKTRPSKVSISNSDRPQGRTSSRPAGRMNARDRRASV